MQKAKWGVCVGMGLLLAGCNPAERLKAEWQGLQALLGTGKKVTSPATPAPSPSSGAYQYSANAQKAKENAELLREMYFVVFGAEPTNRGEFGNYVDTLNQGASFEGVYNGFVHSSNYRKIEVANPGSTYNALQTFSEELAIFQKELPQQTTFGKEAAQPLPMPVDLSSGAPSAEAIHFEKSPKAAPMAGAGDYSKQFAGASIFVLKRVLGDEALKVVAAKEKKREDLANWYASWAVRLASKKVNFGLELRNSADEKFHRDWAMKAKDDQIRWEILNRVHRLLNEMNKKTSG